MDRKETTGLNPMLSLRQPIEEKSEGLCNIGLRPGGIDASNPPKSEIHMLFMFEPKLVQDGVVFPESVDAFGVMAEEEMQEVCEEPQTGMNSLVM